MKEDSYQDDELAKIMKELEEDDKKTSQGYNRSIYLIEQTSLVKIKHHRTHL
jgi:hypothetical protein